MPIWSAPRGYPRVIGDVGLLDHPVNAAEAVNQVMIGVLFPDHFDDIAAQLLESAILGFVEVGQIAFGGVIHDAYRSVLVADGLGAAGERARYG